MYTLLGNLAHFLHWIAPDLASQKNDRRKKDLDIFDETVDENICSMIFMTQWTVKNKK